jgi:hypothetical protein
MQDLGVLNIIIKYFPTEEFNWDEQLLETPKELNAKKRGVI